MFKTREAVLFALTFGTAQAVCQTAAKEPDTLQALLAEVHQLRQDIEGMTVASQRVQIALYALQMQDTAVARSAQRMDAARGRCSDRDEGRLHTASDIQRIEGTLAAGTVPQNEAESLKQRLNELKTRLAAQTTEAEACQADEAEVSTQLRNDQAKLAELQDRIGRLDKALEQFAGTGK